MFEDVDVASATAQLAAGGVGEVLTHEHHDIDEYFARFAASLAEGKPDTDALAEGTRLLKRHIWVEEEIHFPSLRDGELMFQMVLLLREHGEIWLLLDTLAAEVAAGDDSSHTMQTLLAMLECHNPKEEQLIYPAGDDLLPAEVSDEVREALERGVMPDDFRPQIPVD